MNEFEQSITVGRKPERVFAVLADAEKMPEYLPVFRRIERQTGDDRVRAEGEIMGYRFTQTGFFRTDGQRRRIEFGADDPALSTGWIQVTQGPDLSASDVTVHLSLQIRPEDEEMVRARYKNLDELIREGLKAALRSLKNYCEDRDESSSENDRAIPA